MSKVILPQTIGQTIMIETATGYTPAACIAILDYTIGDPTSKDGYFVKVAVKLTDSKGKVIPIDSYSLTVNSDLTLSESLNSDKLFGAKKLACKVNGTDISTNSALAIELLHIMSDNYKPIVGSAYNEPVSVLMSELIKKSTPSAIGREISLGDIVAAFANCYTHKDAGSIITGSVFLSYCRDFAVLVDNTGKTEPAKTEPIANEPVKPAKPRVQKIKTPDRPTEK